MKGDVFSYVSRKRQRGSRRASCCKRQNKQRVGIKESRQNVTNYHSPLVTHSQTQRCFAVTQIAALNTVRKDDICKGLGCVLSMQEAVFTPTARDTSSAMCIKNIPLHD